MQLWDSLEFGAKALQLKQTVSKSREEIETIGRARLEELVEHARTNSEYWGEKLGHIRGSDFELADLPTSNKPELMDNFDRALTVDDVRRDDIEEFFEDESNLGKLLRDKYALSHTSGSQGQPLIIVQPQDNLELLFALQASRGNERHLSLTETVKHLIHPARLAAVILKPGFYPSASAFEYMPEGAKTFLQVLRLCVEDDDMLERLDEFRPTHLTAYASVLHELARASEAGKINFKPELRQIVNISERLMPQAREHYEEIFGAPVLDDYAMGECLFLTNGCAPTGGMHVNADWAILEVVDENNQPVPNGEPGAKVLITNLANRVQPFIRYEIGDIVTMAIEHCDCGNNMPLIDCVEGRDSDIFYIDTGHGEQPLQPSVFELALGKLLDTREYQIVQENNTRFKVRVEPLPGRKFDHERAEKVIRQEVKEYGLDTKIQVEVEVVDRLAADGDQKFKRIISKVKERDEEQERMAS
jgi:phenylacetate-coenzyme A ligase PaaK-like adenylate-forming protein